MERNTYRHILLKVFKLGGSREMQEGVALGDGSRRERGREGGQKRGEGDRERERKRARASSTLIHLDSSPFSSPSSCVTLD